MDLRNITFSEKKDDFKRSYWSFRRGSVVNESDWNHEVEDLIPALAQWVRDPALP